MITLRWAPFPEADVASYRVYRSLIGFRAPVLTPTSLNGLTLQLKMNGGATQTVTFNGTPTVDRINAVLVGGQAYLSVADSDFFILRSNLRTAPGSVQITGGTALGVLGLTARTISEKSEDEVIANLTALEDPEEVVEFDDPDGSLCDFYAVTTVDSLGNESSKTQYRQPITSTGAVCVLEGIVTDLQGVRVPDAEVVAKLVRYPHQTGAASQITLAPVQTLTGPDGRFSLPVIQGALIQLEIPAVGFAKNITVPEKSYEFVTDLVVDLDYRYPLGAEV